MLNATHGTGAYTEKVTSYDKNGNIKALQRYGNGLIDNLTYTYSGNQLTKVEDATGNAAGFSNGANVANEYTYDNNGNLTKDSNKNISSIEYNSLNLPSVVTFSGGNSITYTYAADGTKLRTVHKMGGVTVTTDYCSTVVYESGAQKRLLTEEGYVDLSASTPTYYYYLKDHQGNNRVVINSSGTVQETNHYYPFGGVFASTGNVQPYKYNGKELDTKCGLNWYDYSARHYDAVLGRWHSVDPLAEKMYAWSPYAYCFNNPIKFVDEEGKFPLVSNVIGALLGATVEYTGQVVNNIITDGLSLSNFTQVDAGDILVSAGEGFITSGTSAIKNGIAKATIKLGAEVLRNAVDVNNDSSGNFEVSINSAQETIVNTSLGLIGSEIKTSLNVPINTKSVNKTTEAARKTSHNKGQSFSASQAKQVQIKTKQNNAIVKDVKNVVSDNVNGVASNIVVGIIKVDEEKINK